MPKMKTKSSAKKRFRSAPVASSSAVRRFKRHILTEEDRPGETSPARFAAGS